MGKHQPTIYKLVVGLVSKASTDGFLATSYGSEENTVYGLAQCRGDVEKKDCAACIQEAAKQIRTRCPNEADARIWFDYCFLRYYLIRLLKNRRNMFDSFFFCSKLYKEYTKEY